MNLRLAGSRCFITLTSSLLALTPAALAASPDSHCPANTGALYQRIRAVKLDPQRVYRVRNASIDRPDLHLDLDDGTLAFTEDICGRITGAAFTGEGEVRLRPPNLVERGSLALFTGMAILEEQFTSAYLRFNDQTAEKLLPYLTPASDGVGFVKQWSEAAPTLAEFDALRLLVDFSHFLPPAEHETQGNFSPLLHAHLLGRKLGAFEIVSDAAAPESLWAGQTRMKDGALFFDIWTSFAPGGVAASPVGDASIASFQIQATVHPPTLLQAATAIHLQVRRGGARTLLFELSRFLKIESVQADGRAVDFIQNPAMEGSQLRRKGNDLVALVFPAPLAAGQQLQLRFAYAGEVLSEAGTGLLYVGDRGTWYPSFGLSPARFDIEFHYPATWTLVATGKQAAIAVQPPAASAPAPAEKTSRWISERPLPVAGFNLGKYLRAESRAGSIMVEAYGTKGVEKTFPKPPPEVLVDPAYPAVPPVRQLAPQLVTPPSPSPVHDLQSVADRAALAIDDFTQWFGPFPYGSLALTQMPGDLSQGWPGLVFLSSFAFLSPREQADLHLDPVSRILDSQLLVHETAHQWWGDLVQWPSYRDQWISEGLANYSSLLNLEQQNPAQFREVLDQYRSDLLADNREGERVRDAGPVTLGQRLVSSHFPKGYETIGYERGTWLFHMLRCMLRDSQPPASETLRSRKGRTNPDEPFFRTLRKIRDRYAGKSLSTQQLVEAFAEDLPRPLWYEKRPKLDWFLEGWIEGTSIPRLEAREIRITEKAGGSTVTGVIVQKDAPDDLVTAVPVYATTAGNAPVFLGEVLADGQETSFRLSAPAHIRKVELDPRQTILRSLK